ncbi:YlqD family protein [Bacillus sp. JJ1566]|uniref:YlqD family protein n=1 Tax=Bacillus sp. JJ1566 TaxID=3122961 RepID=UPI003000B6FB
MKIIQTVEVKQILTENSKAKLIDSLQTNKAQLLKECDQLKFELKKMEKLKKFDPVKMKRYFTNEIDIRQEKVKQFEFQIDQIHMLPLGSEIKEKEVQSIIDLNEGDNWDEATTARTIVIKEGIVEEIR